MNTKKIILLMLPFMIFSGCNGQTKKGNDKLLSARTETNIHVSDDTLSKPKVSVKVNKQYDDKGNIVKYDSSYSYFYSSPGGKAMHLSNDSVYSQFRTFFDKKYPNFFHAQYDNVFFNDSLFKYDFFNNDYFMKRFEMNKKMFDRIYQQMDSLKGDFMESNYPKGYQKKNNQTINKK